MDAAVKPIWRTVQIVQITFGVNIGATISIIGPYFYDLFRLTSNDEQALFHTTFLWAIFYGMIALLEIPTGALGDTIGRSKTVYLSLLMRVLYGLVLTSVFFCKTFAAILVVGLISRLFNALAYTFFSGNFSAWVVDSLRERAPGFGYERLLGRGNVYQSWSTLITSLISITLYLHGIPYVAFLVGSLVSLGCLTYCMAEMKETKSLPFYNIREFGSAVGEHVGRTIRIALRVCNKAPVIWWLLGVGAVSKFLMNVIGYLWPIAMTAQFGKEKWSFEWYGLVIVESLLMILGAWALSWLGDRAAVRQDGERLSNRALRVWIMITFLIPAVSVIILGLANQKGLISFPLFALAVVSVKYAFGASEPAFETLVSHYIPGKNAQERATILSMGSLIRALLVLFLIIPSRGTTAMNSPMGWILPGIMLLVAVIIANPRIRSFENNLLDEVPVKKKIPSKDLRETF